MRELKFRAWSEEAKSFEYFDLYEGTECGLTNLQIWARNNPIEQYTGLKDKNGKEIYEGDIVRSSYRITGDFEPTYTNHIVEWEVQPMDDYCDDITVGLWLPDNNEAIEVVGNIHENPELLEEK